MINHAVSDLVSIIKNSQMANKYKAKSVYSKLREEIIKVLQEEGYIKKYEVINSQNNLSAKNLEIFLKYFNNKPVINEIKVVSTPGKRRYCRESDIPVISNGLGDVIISTSQGVMSGFRAKKLKIGGEILIKIF